MVKVLKNVEGLKSLVTYVRDRSEYLKVILLVAWP